MKKNTKDGWWSRTSSRNAKILTELRAQLRQSWRRDGKGTQGFPMNTAYLLAAAEDRLRRKRPPRPIRRVPTPLVSATIHAFVKGVLKEVRRFLPTVYEYMYEEPLHDAFARWRLHSDPNAYERIWDALDKSLDVSQHGEAALPNPHGNWLHRQLLDLAGAAGLAGLTNREMVQFFQFLCPCGARHNREAIKKFRQRRAAVLSADKNEEGRHR